MSIRFLIPRGTNDILPNEIASWQRVEELARALFYCYGYKEIRTPIYEETALFKRSLGQTSDVVNKQLLELKQQEAVESREPPSESHYALRPEGTAAVVRSYIENSLDKKESISKLFYIGPMFRGERPQKGRLRQFHQIGVEVIGPQSAHPYLDAEVIGLSMELLKVLGIEGQHLKLNTLGTPEDKAEFAKYLRNQLRERKSGLCEDCQTRFEQNVFRILDCKNEQCKKLVRELNLKNAGYLSPEGAAYFLKVREALDDLGIKYEWSPQLVRGLDYYTHTVFEISHSGLGSQDALGAGGRYNNLVSDLGGPSVDAIGFAMGIERILLAVPGDQKPQEQSLDVFIVALDEQSFKRGFKILNNLRLAKTSSDMSYKLSSVKSQMRAADKSGSRYVIILGEEEEKKQTVTLKNMQTGEQKEVPVPGNRIEELKRVIQG